MSLEDETLCFSGTLSTQTRKEAEELAKENGAKISKTVTKATTVLVVGEGAGKKAKDAEAKGVAVWTEEEFNEKVGFEANEEEEDEEPKKKKAKTTAKAAKKKAPPPAKKKGGKKKAPEPEPEEEEEEEGEEEGEDEGGEGGVSLEGETLCFSGTLSTQTRAQAQEAAKEAGAKVSTTITKATTVLVTGAGAGKKAQEAKKKKVTVWTEAEFNEKIGRGGDEEEEEEEEEDEEEEPEPEPKKKKAKATTKSKKGRKKKESSDEEEEEEEGGDQEGGASLAGETVCFTGTLTTQTRNQAQETARKHGAGISKSITNATTILVIGPTGAGQKVNQAEAKGITVWTEEEFNEKVGIDDSNAPKKLAMSPKAKKAAAKKKKAEEDDDDDEDDAPAKKKAKKAPPATPKKSPSSAPATPGGTPGGKTRKVMSCVPGRDQYSVHEDYDVKLMYSDSLHANSNKFYKLQLLVDEEGDFFVATNWGRLGETGQSQLKGPHDENKGIAAFSKVFRSKTKNAWGADPFVRHNDKYQLVETNVGDDDADEGGDASLGRLTESQIHKGQEVLKEIREVLDDGGTAGKKRKKTSERTRLGELSNDFYSLIPTVAGRQRPPPLDNLEIVTEKEGLLEFWLRMGFDELGDGEVLGSPIEGVMELPVPKTLKDAAKGISDSHSIKSSCERGSELAENKAGAPVGDMSADLYGSILLYTGNSIYRELNRCLRSDWKKVKKYWNYLRLYHQAMECMPTRKVTLWRGIAVDLYDEYTEGKVVTWWSISSCTSDKSVAENFMNQLGGTAATLITLHTKTACDVSALSFYPHEQESLLRPGTKLRVLNRKRNGNVTEIEVEEVEAEEEDKKPEAAAENGDEKKPEASSDKKEADKAEEDKDEEMKEAADEEEKAATDEKESEEDKDEEMKEAADEEKTAPADDEVKESEDKKGADANDEDKKEAADDEDKEETDKDKKEGDGKEKDDEDMKDAAADEGDNKAADDEDMKEAAEEDKKEEAEEDKKEEEAES